MRILVITPQFPYPPNWGAAMRNYQFARHFSRAHEVRLLTYSGVGETPNTSPLRDLGIGVHLVPWLPPTNKRLAQLVSALTASSHLGSVFHQEAMQSQIDRLRSTAVPDVILLEGSVLSRFDFGGSPIVLDEHNLEYELLQRTFLSERSPLRKIFAYLEYHKFRWEEEDAWRRAAWCVFTSERERLIAESLTTSCTATVPTGVDLDYLTPADEPADGQSIVLTGLIGYRPNTDAVIYFVRKILPLIQRVRPEVVFSVVGKDPPLSVRRLASHRVLITGAVPDVRPYLRKASVVVAPIRFGSGVRVKILEALAMGKPVVSTSLGCEGLNLTSGEHLLVADSPAEFATAVLRLLEDHDLATRLGGAGRSRMEEQYAWPKLASQMEDLLQRASFVGLAAG